WNHEADLEIIATIEQDEQFAVLERSERLLRIVRTLGETHPKNINRHAELLELQLRARMRNCVPAIGADDKIGMKLALAVRRFFSHAGHAIPIPQKIDNFVLHPQLEGWEHFCLFREKIQKVPLRHEGNEFAVRRQTREIGHRNGMTVKDPADLAQLLMREFKKVGQQSELVHHLESGGMNRVAAEIAKEVGVLFQNDHLHAGAREQVTGHHSRRAATSNDAASRGIWPRAHRFDLRGLSFEAK